MSIEGKANPKEEVTQSSTQDTDGTGHLWSKPSSLWRCQDLLGVSNSEVTTEATTAQGSWVSGGTAAAAAAAQPMGLSWLQLACAPQLLEKEPL